MKALDPLEMLKGAYVATYFDPVKFTCRGCGIDGYGKESKPLDWCSPRYCCTQCLWDDTNHSPL